MQDKKIQPVVMGQYIVANKKKADAKLIIATPAVQTCIAVVLISEDAVGLGHFDTFIDLENTLNNMVKEMKKLGNSNIKAQLTGGIRGITPQTTFMLSDSIGKILDKEHISFEYKHYSAHYLGFSAASLYLISNLLAYVGPESMVYSIPLSLVLLMGASTIESLIKNNHYNVSVEAKTGHVTVTENDKEDAKEIYTKLSQHQIAFFKTRMQKGAFDASLRYEKIMAEPNELLQTSQKQKRM